ncbi:GDSL-type esterase/lipase family protein [Pseudonocardia sp. KRD291]|uniref:GDSL-type esterase/lipase family protein n=1 Tax=Pseudonocardia sp. KRD291 TaxID=2792007 RepID=UPI001C4A6462|nr:GDSL-type esterase/lipase family protein [Pseudonocardia sp. KRD291]MBW0105160.1 hypothetical protein [Pseudonocardia sp. KRD291]
MRTRRRDGGHARHHAVAPRRPRPLRRAVLLVGVLAVALGVTAALPADRPQAPEVRASAPGEVRVMPLGASSTEGVGSVGTAGYRLPLWQRLTADGVRVDFVGSRASGPSALPDHEHEGRSGITAARMALSAGGWVLAADPDVVLLHAGTNDLIAGASGATVARRLDALLARIFTAAPDAHVVMAGVWAPLARQGAARAELARLSPGVAAAHRARGHSVEFVDTSRLFAGSGTVDGLHAGPAAYRLIARMWADRIEAWRDGRVQAPSATARMRSSVSVMPRTFVRRRARPATAQ